MEQTKKTFCTCKETSCPLHPTNHDKGCTPCLSKNLRERVLPSCYFNLLPDYDPAEGDSLEAFARAVLREVDQQK